MAFRKAANKVLRALRLTSAVPVRPRGAPPVVSVIEMERELFEFTGNKYELYRLLVKVDPELAGALDSKAALVYKCFGGFTVRKGEKLEKGEKKLLEALKDFEQFIRPYLYDIFFNLLRDGNAVYHVGTEKSKGITKLTHLPMPYLTCHNSTRALKMEKQKEKDKKQQKVVKLSALGDWSPTWYGHTVTKRGVYILSEGTEKEKHISKKKVVHFDLGKQEIIRDIKGRLTISVWTESPLESLKAPILWKHAIRINDMLLRERLVPREHITVKSDLFHPDLFAGATYAERLKAAQDAASTALKALRDSLQKGTEYRYMRPDKGYVTFDDVIISIIESKMKYTDPNALIEQIDKSIYSVILPESAISGRGRASYASELALGTYTSLKAERLVDCIGPKLVELAKIHVQAKSNNKFKESDLAKITHKTTKILERHRLIRDATILREMGIFKINEIRDFIDFDPLTEKELDELLPPVGRKHTETTPESAATAKRKIAPTPPATEPSKEKQQIT